jgi:hypothetical protein
MPPRSSPSGYCATVRTLLHSPTADAEVPPASVLANRVGGRALLLPDLAKVHVKDYPQLRVKDAYQSLELTGMVLTRWYELKLLQIGML